MPVPKRKNDIEVYTQKDLLDRRKELVEDITKSDVNLPDGILHNDLDSGMLSFVSKNLRVVSDGVVIPVMEKILTIQKWGEIATNWKDLDKDNNIKLPMISVVRKPDPQPGSNPSLVRTIPNRESFFYSSAGTWDGRQMGKEIYKIPQPVAVDISYDVTIVCNKMTDLNRLNKIVLQKFSSGQAYTKIKGHFIPILLESISDNTPIDDFENRRMYIQTYSFVLLGFLMDPDEFEVVPTINRMFVLNEFVDNKVTRKRRHDNIDIITVTFMGNGVQTIFTVGETIGVLFNVAINGLTQERDIDYFHISGTSRITFVEPPVEDSVITITYYRGKTNSIVDSDGNVFQVHSEYFEYDGSTLSFVLSNRLNSMITLTINGLVEDEDVGYVIVDDYNITLLHAPIIGANIGVTYIY